MDTCTIVCIEMQSGVLNGRASTPALYMYIVISISGNKAGVMMTSYNVSKSLEVVKT